MGTKVPVNERSRERKFPGTFVPRERKFMGTKGPRNESSRNFRSLGTKVLHRDFSFLGTKGLGYEKSVIRLKQASETVCTDGRVLDKIRERVPDCGRPLKRPGNHNYWGGNMVLQEVDGCWNAAVAVCQHRRPGHSSPTGTVERGRSDTSELSLPASWTPDRGRQANEARRAVSADNSFNDVPPYVQIFLRNRYSLV